MKKNVAKHAKNAWLAMARVVATTKPKAAPPRSRPLRRNPYSMSRAGINTANSNRVGVIAVPSGIVRFFYNQQRSILFRICEGAFPNHHDMLLLLSGM